MNARLSLLVSTRVIRGYSAALLGSHSKRASHAVARARSLQYLCSPRLRLLSPPIVSCTIGLYESVYWEGPVQSQLWMCPCREPGRSGHLGTVGLHDKSWRKKGRKILKHTSIFFFIFFFISVMFWMVWLLWTSNNYWAESIWDVCRFGGRWWSSSLTSSVFKPDDSTGCGSFFFFLFFF